MVIGGQKAVPLKCESCGHEDVEFKRFPLRGGSLAVWLLPHKNKCSECGGRMVVDTGRKILF